MSFQPLVNGGGIGGWQFLKRSLSAQLQAHGHQPSLSRGADYFRESFPRIQSAAALVEDRRVLETTLIAFGLEGDINNRFFLQKIIESNPRDPSALASKLADDRYRELSEYLGLFPGGIARSLWPNGAEEILAKHRRASFEISVGEQNPDMRLALYTERTLPEIADKANTARTKWFKVLGTPPLRQVFEKALGFPASIGKLDIESQIRRFMDKAETVFGSADIVQFSEPSAVNDLVHKFLARSQAESVQAASGGSIALMLLQSQGSGI